MFLEAAPTEVETMVPPYFLDAIVRNQGQAGFGAAGNVYARGGAPWNGGMPFPQPQNGDDPIANITLRWGRHDSAMYAITAIVVDTLIK